MWMDQSVTREQICFLLVRKAASSTEESNVVWIQLKQKMSHVGMFFAIPRVIMGGLCTSTAVSRLYNAASAPLRRHHVVTDNISLFSPLSPCTSKQTHLINSAHGVDAAATFLIRSLSNVKLQSFILFWAKSHMQGEQRADSCKIVSRGGSK